MEKDVMFPWSYDGVPNYDRDSTGILPVEVRFEFRYVLMAQDVAGQWTFQEEGRPSLRFVSFASNGYPWRAYNFIDEEGEKSEVTYWDDFRYHEGSTQTLQSAVDEAMRYPVLNQKDFLSVLLGKKQQEYMQKEQEAILAKTPIKTHDEHGHPIEVMPQVKPVPQQPETD